MAANRRLTPIRFGIRSALVDRAATELAYAHCSGSVTRCECVPCRNFMAAGDYAFPAPVLALLADLGIDSRCEAEVYSLGRGDNGPHQYGGWVHFIGELEAEIDNVERVGVPTFFEGKPPARMWERCSLSRPDSKTPRLRAWLAICRPAATSASCATGSG
jgi:hypothetical protein